MENPSEILSTELIGLQVKVISKDTYGKIIDETKNMFLIMHGKKKKMVHKKDNIFEIEHHGQKVIIKGNSILMRPEERIKIAK